MLDRKSLLTFLAFTVHAQAAQADTQTCSHDVWAAIEYQKDNQTALRTTIAPAWVPEPQVRGTFSILQTCLLTLVACIYTALHLNVPPKTGFWNTLSTKGIWVLMALLAPEVVLFAAMRQLLAASTLAKELQKLQAAAPKGTVDTEFNFDVRYGFFILMGGLQIDADQIRHFISRPDLGLSEGFGNAVWGLNLQAMHHYINHDSRARLRLTPRCVLELARSGLWAYVSPDSIRDRSKADGIQKALVLLQVLWMAISCIARKANGLPLSLLEIHTMVHVFCALLMYILWFKKPLDIRDPEIFSWPDSRQELLAAACHETFYEDNELFLYGYEQDNGTESCRQMISNDPPKYASLPCNTSSDIHITYRPYDERFRLEKHADIAKATKRWHSCLRLTQSRRQVHAPPGEMGQERLVTPWDGDDSFVAFGFVGKFAAKDDLITIDLTNNSKLDSLLFILGWVLLPTIYGGIHLTAWAFDFSAPVEQLLWRTSCLTLTTAAPVIALLVLVADNAGDFAERLVLFVFKFGSVPFVLFYMFCRVFIVVESFLNLRHTPIGAFWVPSWLLYIPHV